MIRVVIFDDMPVYAHGLSHVLEQNGMTVTGIRESYRATEPRWTADVAVVAHPVVQDATTDPTPPSRPPPHLLVVDEQPSLRGLAPLEHVSGYVRRTASVSTVVRAVRAVARGEWFMENPAADTSPTGRTNPLSSREHQVLLLIARGFTHAQIATRLGISRHTVDTYIRRVRSKWSLGNTADLTRAALLASRT